MDAIAIPTNQTRSTLQRGFIPPSQIGADAMPLTPADVHNVAFSKPPIGKAWL